MHQSQIVPATHKSLTAPSNLSLTTLLAIYTSGKAIIIVNAVSTTTISTQAAIGASGFTSTLLGKSSDPDTVIIATDNPYSTVTTNSHSGSGATGQETLSFRRNLELISYPQSPSLLAPLSTYLIQRRPQLASRACPLVPADSLLRNMAPGPAPIPSSLEKPRRSGPSTQPRLCRPRHKATPVLRLGKALSPSS